MKTYMAKFGLAWTLLVSASLYLVSVLLIQVTFGRDVAITN